ncbi:hypothetical protein [Streptomyces sp. R44]|uniref:Uncharacterized protein n=1 Tax=Streptomyces sp. R44 TaxID=3238633 RepID=A0AB39TB06_9ACTN
MGGLWKYFEENNEIFAALVAFLAIGGGLLGSVIGAKIQANGGRDQAAAAREAAQIAAEAQRVAALWTVRQVLAADYIHQTRVVVEATKKLFKEDDEDGHLRSQLDEDWLTLMQKRAGLELTATLPVVDVLKEVNETMAAFVKVGLEHGQEVYAQTYLTRLRGDRVSQGATSAIVALLGYQGSSSAGRVDAMRAAATRLQAVTPTLSDARINALLSYYARPEDCAPMNIGRRISASNTRVVN